MRRIKYYILFLIVIITLYFYKTYNPYNEDFIANNIVFWSEDVDVSLVNYTGKLRNRGNNINSYHGLLLTGENRKKAKFKAIFQKNKSWIIDEQSECLEFNLQLSKARFDYVESLARKFNLSVDSVRYASSTRFDHITDSLGDHFLVKLHEYDEYVDSYIECDDYVALRILHEVNELRFVDLDREVNIEKMYEELKSNFLFE